MLGLAKSAGYYSQCGYYSFLIREYLVVSLRQRLAFSPTCSDSESAGFGLPVCRDILSQRSIPRITGGQTLCEVVPVRKGVPMIHFYTPLNVLLTVLPYACSQG